MVRMVDTRCGCVCALHTLGLLEDTLVDTILQGLVEEGVEHLLGDIDRVVGADILLEGLAAGDVLTR